MQMNSDVNSAMNDETMSDEYICEKVRVVEAIKGSMKQLTDIKRILCSIDRPPDCGNRSFLQTANSIEHRAQMHPAPNEFIRFKPSR